MKDLPYEFYPVNCNNINDVSIYIYCNATFEAPLQANTAIGYLTVSIHNENVLSLDIYNSNVIPQKNYRDFWNDMIENYTTYLESLLYKNNLI